MATPTKKKIIEYLGDEYQESDDYLIDLYVENHQIYRKMRQELKGQPLMIDYTNKAGATNPVKNPLLIEIPKYVTLLNGLLKSLGLTVAQRQKLTSIIEDGDADDDFDKF